MLVKFLTVSGYVDVAARAAAIARQECALRWSSAEQRAALSDALYRVHSRYQPGGGPAATELHPFERDAIARYFPSPPATVLVGGAGSGREGVALARLGFVVRGFYEPCDDLLSRCRSSLAGAGVAAEGWKSTHEQLSDPVKGAPYDACVVGWGSYTHVLGQRSRVRFLANLRRSSPEAPVLVSFLCRETALDGAASGALRFQSAVRGLLAHLPGRSVPEPGDAYLQEAGFVHLFTRAEIEHEAADAGYRMAHYAEMATYPHAVLMP